MSLLLAERKIESVNYSPFIFPVISTGTNRTPPTIPPSPRLITFSTHLPAKPPSFSNNLSKTVISYAPPRLHVAIQNAQAVARAEARDLEHKRKAEEKIKREAQWEADKKERIKLAKEAARKLEEKTRLAPESAAPASTEVEDCVSVCEEFPENLTFKMVTPFPHTDADKCRPIQCDF